METLASIAEKLSRLEKRDANRAIFGADSHQYRRNPALTEEAAAAFDILPRVSKSQFKK